MEPREIEVMERATVAGVGAIVTAEIGGWLVPLDANPISRGRSAVPLRHDLGPGAISEIETAFARHGRPPLFRLAEAEGLKAAAHDLEAKGYTRYQPTLVKIAEAGEVAACAAGPAEVLPAPDRAWEAMFGGAGFDPEDSAARIAAFRRVEGSVYGVVREDEQTLAVGVASFAHGWAAISGVRTAAHRRGEGLGGRVMAGLAIATLARGASGILLQVEADNPAAISLYRRIGFREVWTYSYWRC